MYKDNPMTDGQKTALLRQALALAERASYLLDRCYEAHMKAVQAKAKPTA